MSYRGSFSRLVSLVSTSNSMILLFGFSGLTEYRIVAAFSSVVVWCRCSFVKRQ